VDGKARADVFYCTRDEPLMQQKVETNLPGRRENTHQLLEGLERSSEVELDVILLDVVHVRGKRRIVVRVEPLP
jgi:hypothetical protein